MAKNWKDITHKGKAVFVYTSVCCTAPAKKPAVVRSPEDKKAKEYSKCGLGVWRCTNCERVAKVTRSKNKEEVQQ